MNMLTARHLKHSIYLCGAAIVAAGVFGPLAIVPFVPPATVLWWLAIKATWDDDAPPIERWDYLFDREILIGWWAAVVWVSWTNARRIEDDGWAASVWAAIGADPDMLPPTWLLAILVGVAMLVALFACVIFFCVTIPIWIENFGRPKLSAVKDLTRAGMKIMGEDIDYIMPECFGPPHTIKESGERIGKMFDDAEKKFKITFTPQLQNDLNAIILEAKADVVGELAELQALVDRLTPSRTMPAEAYKWFTDYDSALGRATRAGGGLGHYAGKIRAALDRHLERTAFTPTEKEGVAMLKEARRQWYARGVILDSVNDSNEAGWLGLLDPDKLARNAKGAEPGSDLAQLAKAAGSLTRRRSLSDAD
jgi:hypothetical protein